LKRRTIGQYSGESLVNVKADVDEVIRLLENFKGNRNSMRRRILSGIGTSVKQAVKKNYTSLLHKRSKTLYKSITAKIFKSGAAIKISPTAERGNILYGYALARGPVIEAQKADFLTFKIGEKWVRKHQVHLKPVDWVEGPAKRYLSSSAYRQRLEELTQKEITRAEKAASKRH